MPAGAFPDRRQDPRGLAGFQDDDDLIGLRPPEVSVDEVVAASGRRLDDWRAPLCRAGLDPVLVLRGDVAQHRLAHRVQLAIAVDETDHPLGLLKRLNQPVQQDAIETPVRETNAIVMMLVEGVHGCLQASTP